MLLEEMTSLILLFACHAVPVSQVLKTHYILEPLTSLAHCRLVIERYVTPVLKILKIYKEAMTFVQKSFQKSGSHFRIVGDTIQNLVAQAT
jgi:hypothetical protein